MTQNKPLFSVIMPSYNHAEFISDAINSVVSQTVKNIELIIVDDFSADTSRDIIRNWSNNDGRIRTIFHQKNEGIARTFNDGIKNARGKYIALMASDDMFKEDALEKILARLESSEDHTVVIVEGECVDSQNRRTGVLFSELHRKPSQRQGDFLNDLANGNFVCTGIVRKSVIEKHQIYYNENLRYLNDWLFWIDLSHVCEFIFLEEPLYYYRIHERNCRNVDLAGMTNENWMAQELILNKYDGKLHRSTKLSILGSLWQAYLSLGDFKKARRFLSESIPLNSSPTDCLKSTMLIVMTYIPSTFTFYKKVKKVRTFG